MDSGKLPFRKKYYQMSRGLACLIASNRNNRTRVISIPTQAHLESAHQPSPARKQSLRKRVPSFVAKDPEPESPGPGHYDVLSKSIKRRMVSRPFDAPSTRAGEVPSTRAEEADSLCSSEQQQYVKLATPGPGTYQSEVVHNTSQRASKVYNRNKLVIRVKDEDKVGPGYYQTSPRRRIKRANKPFESGDRRFPDCSYKGPQADYFVRQFKIKEAMLDKYIKGYVGNFGTHQERFKSAARPVPPPGAYQPSHLSAPAVPVFPRARRFQTERSKGPGVGSYDLVIEQRPVLMDADLMPRRAAFNVSEQRL